MTSTASPPNTQAPISSAATSVPSYASAAGASKKPVSTPVVATGAATSTPVVVGGPSAQHAKSSGPPSMNGRPPITPAVPTAPHGPSNMNGAGNHSRKTSVTIPSNFAGNGGPVGGGAKSNIQFGFKDSPAISHSTPQMTSAPVPIPGSNHQRIPSPAHSPSPIPQPSGSGGRPPSSMAQQNTQMTFGSLGSDGDVSSILRLLLFIACSLLVAVFGSFLFWLYPVWPHCCRVTCIRRKIFSRYMTVKLTQ